MPAFTVTTLLTLGKEAVEIGIEETGEITRSITEQAKKTLAAIGLSPEKLLLIAGAIGAGYLLLMKRR